MVRLPEIVPAVCAAGVLLLVSIGATAVVPPAQTAALTEMATVELA